MLMLESVTGLLKSVTGYSDLTEPDQGPLLKAPEPPGQVCFVGTTKKANEPARKLYHGYARRLSSRA